jgi:hypothetical protein
MRQEEEYIDEAENDDEEGPYPDRETPLDKLIWEWPK